MGEEETKQEKETTAGIGSDTLKGLLAVYSVKQTLLGLKERTVKRHVGVLRLLHKRGANLLDPQSAFGAIDHAKRIDRVTKQLTDEEWSDGSKAQACQAYLKFCEISKIPVPPDINFHKYTRISRKLPWIPLASEIDSLIAGCSRRVGTFLQLLKETGARCGEVWQLKWTDVDLEHGIVTINSPEKGGNPRQFKVSGKLIAMLNAIPKTSQKVFGDKDLNMFRKNFISQRKRVAYKLQNPRLNQITFHTLRHFFGTMEYFKTKNILHVQERLGHKSILNTMLYTHLVNFESDEYDTATSTNLKEDEELLKAGFEYVTEREGIKIYRKRK